MKKLAILFALFWVPAAIGQNDPYVNYNNTYSYKEQVIDGMRYGVWYVRKHNERVGYALSVVNITKDKLEIELMRAELINELKKHPRP